MNFVLKPPSLEQRALVKVAVSLWKQNDVGALIALMEECYKYDVSLFPSNEKWKEIEARVLERVAQLPLPKPLNEKVSCFVQTVGFEICKWIEDHCIRYDLVLNLPLELCWTAQVTVDRKRTAELLVRDESLGIATRYKLACVYCLEDDIMALWNTLSEDLKQSFFGENYPSNKEWIINFWSRTMKRRGLGHAPTSYKSGFVQCAYQDNKVAAEYFLPKLTPLEREECLVEAAKCMYDGDTLCFSLSQMDEWQQMEVFKEDPSRVLQCFLQWPFQSFFMEVGNCMWDFLPEEDYECLLREIIYKVINGYKDWNYHKLFREFWQKSPDALKSWITNDLDESQLLPALCRIKDEEIIRLILQNTTPVAREKLIYNEYVHSFCQDWILGDEWHFLEFFIRECLPSKNEMLKFKEAFEKTEKQDDAEGILVRNNDKWDKLFPSSDDSLREYEKRSDDEGESSSSKRFRSLQ